MRNIYLFASLICFIMSGLLFCYYSKKNKLLLKGKIIKKTSQGKYSVKDLKNTLIEDCFTYTIEYTKNNLKDTIETELETNEYEMNREYNFYIENGKAYIANYYFIFALAVIILAFGILFIIMK